MKNKNSYYSEQPTSCKADRKKLKAHRKFLEEGREIIYDIIDNNLVPYEIQNTLIGSVESAIRSNDKELKLANSEKETK